MLPHAPQAQSGGFKAQNIKYFSLQSAQGAPNAAALLNTQLETAVIELPATY